MELKRGDTKNIKIKLPNGLYNPGDRLYFMAKLATDDDPTDSDALIKREITSTPVPDGDYQSFDLKLLPADTASIKMQGRSKLVLKAEVELRTPGGDVFTMPGDKNYIRVIVYADVRKGGDG